MEGNRSGESRGTQSLVPSQSLGQKTVSFVVLTSAQVELSGEVVRKTVLARVCVQEKLEGPRSHSQIPLSVPKLRDTRLGASNKMGSPQCLHRQASKSF